MRLTFAYNNFYFDSNDYGNPIKTFIDDKIWFKIMADRNKNADVFVRQNFASLEDGYIQITGEQEISFISIASQRETFDVFSPSDNRVASVFFRMDGVVDTYERQVYSSGDLLAQVGGIYSFLRGIGGVFVFMFSERLLVSALAGKLYQVYEEKDRSRK